MIPHPFQLQTNTFTRDRNGQFTRDRFLRFDGYGLQVFVTATEAGYKQIYIVHGDHPEYTERYGGEYFHLTVKYEDVMPVGVTLNLYPKHLSAGEVSLYASRLQRIQTAMQAVNDLITHIDEILTETEVKP